MNCAVDLASPWIGHLFAHPRTLVNAYEKAWYA